MVESFSQAAGEDSAYDTTTSSASTWQATPWPATYVQEAIALLLAADGSVEVDSHFDSDSGFSTGLPSATPSLSHSVFDFTYANGRRYHSHRFQKADYYLPNDEQEQSRLDLYHHIFLMMLGGSLYTAPIDHPQRVLDVGTGTGIWAVDFADMHPTSEVVGNDISPIQPSWAPSNLTFEVDDVEENWVYPEGHFNYIHMRSLSGSIADWENVLKNAYKSLAPGGWIEYQDYGCEGFCHDGTPFHDLPEDQMSAVGRWFILCEAAAAKFGRPLTISKDMERFFKEAGFVDVRVRKEIY